MREVCGVVCIATQADAPRSDRLFGKFVRFGKKGYESFSTNDLTPFDDLTEAQKAQAELEARNDFSQVALAGIWLRMHPLRGMHYRVNDLADKSGLVVVSQDPDSRFYNLWGSRRSDEDFRVGHIPGTLLEMNEFTPFNNFDDAYHCGFQIDRQMQHYPFVAEFRLVR